MSSPPKSQPKAVKAKPAPQTTVTVEPGMEWVMDGLTFKKINRRLLTTAQAAAFLGLGKSEALRMIAEKELTAHKVGKADTGHWRISAATVLAWRWARTNLANGINAPLKAAFVQCYALIHHFGPSMLVQLRDLCSERLASHEKAQAALGLKISPGGLHNELKLAVAEAGPVAAGQPPTAAPRTTQGSLFAESGAQKSA